MAPKFDWADHFLHLRIQYMEGIFIFYHFYFWYHLLGTKKAGNAIMRSACKLHLFLMKCHKSVLSLLSYTVHAWMVPNNPIASLLSISAVNISFAIHFATFRSHFYYSCWKRRKLWVLKWKCTYKISCWDFVGKHKNWLIFLNCIDLDCVYALEGYVSTLTFSDWE